MSAVIVIAQDKAQDPGFLEAMAWAKSDGRDLTVKFTTSAEHMQEIATDACHNEASSIIAVGGDGTLNLVLRGVLASACETPLGLLPMGTGNDFARLAGIPNDNMIEALRRVLDAEPRKVDVGFVNDRPFINVTVVGQPAEVTQQTPAALKAALGEAAYGLYGLMKMRSAATIPMSVSGEGIDWSGNALGVAVGNGRDAGGGFTVAPGAKVDDGLLNVMIIPQMEITEAVQLARALSADEGDADPEALQLAVRGKVSQLVIESAKMCGANFDGEPMQAERFEFRIEPGRVRFRMPVAE